ncbi:MAG: lysylphosphatidylglycerol synthase transmembrane domain-containing protein [Desulfobacterales bacterium]|jgi:uncharacterized protein (TIRG00374 family)|nr:lysylphosphatidylglycerol synthase transmembrane domain-containing protein [Desulfobacterales bacterium]MDD3080626.1 lysylphosphatidylglycerol synthase transmembrane domain-containing protein [Desulfobacterales bacterium]MDD3949633.1 lysylphosphatidylglycerol synthase transmembrane domain-containing protein [Desulfobacterales bacterium]MDY0377080.1 lysylphosphatidylglycerol synthase transmembrane domain-containing protein [Desulfobacterales bacterium]
MKKRAATLAAGVAISIATLYLAFRNVPFRELVAYMRTIRYLWVIPSAAAVALSFLLRALRWQIILTAANRPVSFWQAFHPLMIGFMLNCVAPGRIGEVARPIVLQKKEAVPFTTGLATVAAERLFDVMLLIVFFSTVMTVVDIDPDISLKFGGHTLNRSALEAVFSGMVTISLVLIAGIIAVSLSVTRMYIIRLLDKLPGLFFFTGFSFRNQIRQHIIVPLIRMVENIAGGFSLIRFPRSIFLCLALSLLIWLLSALSYYLMMLGSPGIGLSFSEISTVMIIVCFFIALPSAPGFWGLWEAGGVFALSLFGVSSTDAAGFTLANHAVQMFPVILVGWVSALVTGIDIRRISEKT